MERHSLLSFGISHIPKLCPVALENSEIFQSSPMQNAALPCIKHLLLSACSHLIGKIDLSYISSFNRQIVLYNAAFEIV